MKQASILLMILTILTKFFGLAREKALAHFFGTSTMAGVFLVAFSLPLVISNLLSGAIGTGFIPIYERIYLEENKNAANRFMSNLTNIIFILAIILAMIGIVFAKPLVKLMSPGFEGEVLNTAVFVTRIALISIIATSIAAIYRAYLQIKGHFLISMSHSILMNLILIGAMALSGGDNPLIIAIGILLSLTLQYIIFIPYVRKSGYRHKLILDKTDPDLKKLLHIILPILISTSVIELNLLINKAIASSISLSGISIINYASKIQGFVTGIVVTSIITVVYPQMTRVSSKKDFQALGKMTGESLSMMSLLVLPATLGLMIFSEEVVRLLFLGGAFNEQDVAITGYVLLFYAFGIIGIGVREIITRVFYAQGETRIPVKNSIIMVILNIILSYILSRYFGLSGLSLGTSLSLIVGAILILIDLKEKMEYLGLREKTKNLALIALSSILMAIIAKFSYHFLTSIFSLNISLLLSIGIGIISYLILLVIFKIDELEELIQFIKNKNN